MKNSNVAKLACVVLVFCIATTISSSAQDFTFDTSFTGAHGENPVAPVVQGTDGDFYGATAAQLGLGYGTIFKVTRTGQVTTVHHFCIHPTCADGSYPLAGLVLATDGAFYGTASNGGVNGWGTVFRVTPGGDFSVLYAFCSLPSCVDGGTPAAGLVLGANGNFYGTTEYGGANSDGGTVFELTPQGQLTVLHTFCLQSGCPDGFLPLGALVQATDGNFYGTTNSGGVYGYGAVFSITPSGKFTTLYSFCAQSNCADGSSPYSGLIQASNGLLYGTTAYGGPNVTGCTGYGCGTIFQMTLDGQLTTLYDFCPDSHSCPTGEIPMGGLVQATDGNFYGSTSGGGSNDMGVLFAITHAGELTVRHSFRPVEGEFPASLVQGTGGDLYGTAESGGTHFDGSVFAISVGLGPFVATVPTTGRVGEKVIILGNGLTRATSVSFKGTPATFTVVSDTEITTTVPAGATTGKIEVKLGQGTLSSNVAFQIVP